MANVRLLHVTDTHLGLDAWYEGAPKGWRRADDHHDALHRALEPARRGEVDGVVHTGDVFDRSRPPPRAVFAAAALLTEIATYVPVLVLAGNHDRHGIRRHFPDGLPGVRLFDGPARLDFCGVDLAVVPYLREAGAWAAAATIAHGADLLLCHQSFDGCRVPGHVFRPGQHAETVAAHQLPHVSHIACGHLHPRQRFRLGEAEIVMPGSTERTAFVERFQPKGVARWEFGATTTCRFDDVPTRRMVALEREEDVLGVGPGDLVWLHRSAPEDWAEGARARGGWTIPRPKPKRQVALFGGRPG